MLSARMFSASSEGRVCRIATPPTEVNSGRRVPACTIRPRSSSEPWRTAQTYSLPLRRISQAMASVCAASFAMRRSQACWKAA